jgi:exodeoxyribonuclease VII large subunit
MSMSFSEQQPAVSSEKVVSVGQLTQSIKGLLEGGLGTVAVRGEISNWKPASSGHIYFSVKDSDASLSAALFRGAAMRTKLALFRDGVEVVARGRISVYPPRGTYQIICESLEPVGAGTLQAQFEALKKKLQAEGLFALERKRSLPQLPERIVVITSPTGAAIRDVLSVLTRRFAGVKVLVVPALVQGAEAPSELCKALRIANEFNLGDVILLTRGGGSIEDLWAFNDEQLAREIYASRIPVVSAVGHEVDFTIADFVADLRAPTPSAAAEILVKEKQQIVIGLQEVQLRLVQSARQNLKRERLSLQALLSKLKNPKDRITDLRLRFDDWSERLFAAMERNIETKRQLVIRSSAKLEALSPLRVLERGYSIAFDLNGKAVRSKGDLTSGSDFRLRLKDGEVQATVRGP